MPFVLAAVVTLLVGTGVSMETYFAGDIRTTRELQAATGDPARWATPVSRLAPAPGKYFVMAITIIAAFLVGGWRGLAVMVAFLLIEQYGAEHTKGIVQRPRPDPHLVRVIGTPSGFSFPSTTMTFFCATFGAVGVLALVRRKAPFRMAAMVLGFGMVLLGCAARVALGAHWPSDVLLTCLICLVWIWAAARVVLSRA